MSDVAQTAPVVIEPEPSELQERHTWAGARLLVSSTVFLFLPFVFGYLYLASLNTSGLWRPGHLKGPLGWGIAIMLAVVVSAGLVAPALARRSPRRGRGRGVAGGRVRKPRLRADGRRVRERVRRLDGTLCGH